MHKTTKLLMFIAGSVLALAVLFGIVSFVTPPADNTNSIQQANPASSGGMF